MERGLINITSATTTTLRDINNSLGGNVKSISLANTSPSTSVRVQVFLEDALANKSYIVVTDIPGLVTLVLNDVVSFNNAVLALKITTSAGGLGTSTPLSAIIK